MKANLLLHALLLSVAGLAQPALAASPGVWACPAATLSSNATTVMNAQVRVWNLGDAGTLTIRGIRIYDHGGTLYPVASAAVQLGAHQSTIIQVRQLLGLPIDAPGMVGIQVLVEWEATPGARPWAEAIRTISSRDPLTGTLSNDSIACLELK